MCPEVTAKGLKKYCIADERYGRQDEGEVGNVGSKHESVSREREIMESETEHRNSKQNITGNCTNLPQ
jgi:hypothetical protein